MVNQANHLSATYLTVMYESRTQSNYNQYCFSLKSPSLAFVVVVSGNVSVIYLVARMEGRNGDQMYLLKVANVIAFASRRPPSPSGPEGTTPAPWQYVHSCLWIRAKQIITHASPAPPSVWALLCVGDKGVFYLLMSHSACVWVAGGALFPKWSVLSYLDSFEYP